MPEPTVFDAPDYYTQAENIAALPRMLLGDDLRDATQRLRDEAKRWLPPYEAEETRPGADGSPSDYDQRVARATVEPYYERAILRDVASVLGKAIVLGDDVPLEIRGTDQAGVRDAWWENIDLRGNNGDVFLREVVKDAAGDRGLSAVLVDHPPVAGDAKLSDLLARGLRPFWRHYKARDVIEASPEYVNGRERLREVRLREEAPAGHERVRVLRAAPWNEAEGAFVGYVTFELWERKTDAEDAAKAGYIVSGPEGQGEMRPHVEIPLVPLYYQRTGFFRGRNAYMGLARLNLLHTQEATDHRDDLWLHGGTKLVMTGGSDEDRKQRVIGRRRVIAGPADFTVTQITRPDASGGGYIEELESLEAKMQALANEPHVRRSGDETATGRAIDSAEARTEIQARCLAVKDFVEQLLMFTAAYGGHKSGGSVTVISPMPRMERNEQGNAAVKEAVKEGWVQPITYVKMLQQQGLLPDDVDPEAEVELAGGRVATDAGLRPPVPPQLERVRAAIAAAEGGPPAAPPVS